MSLWPSNNRVISAHYFRDPRSVNPVNTGGDVRNEWQIRIFIVHNPNHIIPCNTHESEYIMINEQRNNALERKYHTKLSDIMLIYAVVIETNKSLHHVYSP